MWSLQSDAIYGREEHRSVIRALYRVSTPYTGTLAACNDPNHCKMTSEVQDLLETCKPYSNNSCHVIVSDRGLLTVSFDNVDWPSEKISNQV